MVPRVERRRQKPLTERKRRARINKCLEQLKDVVINNNGGILPRLDKARILELTVSHLKTIKFSNTTEIVEKEKFKAGYLKCLNEVSIFLQDRTDDDTLNQVVQHLFAQNIQSKSSSQMITHNSIDQEPIESFVSNSNASEALKHNFLDQEPIKTFVSNTNSPEVFKHSLTEHEPIKTFVSNTNSPEVFKHSLIEPEPIGSFVSNSSHSEDINNNLLDQPIGSFVSNSKTSDAFKHCFLEQKPIPTFDSNSNNSKTLNNSVYDIGHTASKQIADQDKTISKKLFISSNRYVAKRTCSDNVNLNERDWKSPTSCEEYSMDSTDNSTNENDCCKKSRKRPIRGIDVDYWINGGHSSRSYFSVDKTVNCSVASCQIIWRPW